ncbi:MAG: hypothetical protein PHW95_05280 [Patescibacteria group bacterium]|nr:hypothetical protein [Patescibacteria group bacterium]
MRTLTALLVLLACGCATTIGTSLLSCERPTAAATKVPMIYTFSVTFWQPTEVKGIPFFVHCRANDDKQGFLLFCRVNGNYSPNVANGYIGSDGIVWIDWLLERPTFGPHQTVTFELYPIGRDNIGVISVSLLGDGMFTWDGNDPKNPPE